MTKKTFIVSTYNTHEFIHTEDAYCALQIMFKYHNKGYKVWDYPLSMVIFFKKYLNISLNWGNKNVNIEKYIPGSNQITWYSPYSY
jgi:hypothetical protein